MRYPSVAGGVELAHERNWVYGRLKNYMTKHNTTDQRPLEKTAKKPYLKPSFEREKVFETQALTCGKMESTQSGCHQSRKHS